MRHTPAISILAIHFLIFFVINQFFNPHPDMIDHWVWSKYLSFSYFEHPPMIAWLFGVITFIGGDSEMTLEIGSQIITLLILSLIYYGTYKLYGQKSSLITLIILCSMPYFTLGSIFLHITQPFLFFWFLALFILLLFHKYYNYKYLILLGIVAGLGALSKYIMLLFYMGIFIHILLFPRIRKEIFNPWLYVAGILSIIIFIPVLLWNYQHDWISFRWQWDKGATGGEFGENFLGFTIGHIFLFSPLWFVMSVLGTWWIRDRLLKPKSNETIIFVISILPLIFFTIMSLKGNISDPHWVNITYAGIAIFLGNEIFLRLEKSRLIFLMGGAILMNFAMVGFIVIQALYPIVEWMPYETKNIDYLRKKGIEESIIVKLSKNSRRYYDYDEFHKNLKNFLTHSDYTKYSKIISKVSTDASANRLNRIIAWDTTGKDLKNLLEKKGYPKISFIVSREYQLSSALSYFLKYSNWPHSIEKKERNLWSPLKEVKKGPSIFVCELFECQGDLVAYYKRFNLPLKYLGEVEILRKNRMIRNLQVYYINPNNQNI